MTQIPFKELTERMARCGITLQSLSAAARKDAPNARTFRRNSMSTGSLPYTVWADGPDAPVYSDTIDKMLKCLGVPSADFWAKLPVKVASNGK